MTYDMLWCKKCTLLFIEGLQDQVTTYDYSVGYQLTGQKINQIFTH